MRKTWMMGMALAALATPAAAQEAVEQETGEVSTLVVVGSRGAPRLVTDSPAPVDVWTGEALAARGFNDLTKVLAFLSPSFNYPRASSSPSSVGARPATLRGLGPDQVLVLIDGHRRHASASINFNNGVGRGTVPVDYNMIPIAAVERIEVLRDGAAAQYGSDAIAGVINIVLKAEARGGLAQIQAGVADDGEGETIIMAGRKGFALGQDGFLTVSGEVRDRGATNAAEIDPRFGRVTSTLGDPDTTDAQMVANAEIAIAGGYRAYGFLTAGQRASAMSPLFRAPNVAPNFYPQGFLPVVDLDLTDVGAAIGVRGQVGGWDLDLSDTYGYSRADYSVANSVNTSLGAASPTEFDGGGARYSQNLVNLTLGRDFALAAGAHVSAGLEHRREAYELVAGDMASRTLAGAQGFPGFNPPVPVDVSRTAYSAFVDTEIALVDGLDLGLAARFEDYSDFGQETTGKASLFWRPVPLVAFRASASTGFRAPSLQQQYFSTVTSQLLPTGQISNVGNFAVTDPVSLALGASPLRPETSVNYAAGLVLTPAAGLSLSLDAYRIEIEDRIALSENIQGPQVSAILLANGITNASVARFFTNAADTVSEGYEITAAWRGRFGTDGRFALTLGYGMFDTDVDALQVNPVLPQIALLGSASIGVLADAQPRSKALANAEAGWGGWTLALDLADFGAYRTPTAVGDQVLNGATTADISVSYAPNDVLTLTFGVLNATDEYPARLAGDTTGRPYSEADPVGFNGREYFLRAAARF